MNWPDGAALTAFGRQALSLVAQQLRTESVTCLLAPDYYCQTMLVPFLMEGIQVHVVVTGADCLMHGDALLAAVDSHPGCAILHCETFGNRPHADLAATLHDTAGRGIKLIIDRTHSWLDPATTPADFTTGFGDSTVRCSPSRSYRPADSASRSAGTSPAQPTRFGSSKTGTIV